MLTSKTLSRRSLLASAAAASAVVGFAKSKVPIGLELYSVRKEFTADIPGTLKAVAKMGYQGVEFFSSYYAWTPEQTKDVRKQLDDLGMKCYGTHNGAQAFAAENLGKTIELNKILGSRCVIMASAGKVDATEDGWKKVAHTLEASLATLKPTGMLPGFHNHAMEFRPLENGGKRPIEVIAGNTSKDVVLQLDVGTCVEVGYDPIAWIKQNAGRIKSMHCKDWSKEQGFQAVFGEGASPWVEIFKTSEKVGGIEHYLIEQEGSKYTPIETAQRCIDNYRNIIQKV